ncbi:MATE family efflux transporter [uncultured Treponema sp.]|uniref:MATE family efflux transporter n=1 Tax=uncultured Treponema sp. TaxID=162155 RepID=UPI0025D0FE97|nr:MATE family efflux transporter [uncultured Treponema sp.]
MEKNLTSGSVLKNVVCFSLPYLLSYFLQTLYGMADLFIIGQFGGVEQTTAVSIGSQVMHMITVMIVGLSMGSTVIIARSVGAENKKSASCTVGNTATLFMLISLGLALILLVFARRIVFAMSTPEQAVDGTFLYLSICFAGIPFITAYNIISSIFRGLGDSKSPMYFIAIACAANIILDYIFMGALKLGPAGAALGTTLSQAVSVAIALAVIIKRKLISVSRSDFILRREIVFPVLKIGFPVAMQDGFIQISFILITIIANRRGLADAAAVGIVEKIMSFMFLVPSSMLSTVSALAAQNIGAKKYDRADSTLRFAAFIATGFGLTMAVLIQFSASSFVALFTADSAVVLLGAQYLRGYIWDCFLGGIHFSFSGYFCALGKSGISFLHNLLSIVLVRVPGAYFMSKLFPENLFPMGIATACGSLLSVIICVTAFCILRKKKNFATSANPF